MRLKVLGLFFLIATQCVSAQLLDKIVAVVDQELITSVELKEATNNIQHNLSANKQPIPENLINQVLEHLIDEKIQLQQAKLMHIVVSDADINKIIKDQKITKKQKDAIKKELIIARLQKSILANSINITQDEVANFIASYQLQNKKVHIVDWLVEVDEEIGVTALNKKLAHKLFSQIKSGSKVSIPAIRTDLGWRKVQDLPDVFVKSVNQAKSGAVLRPLSAPNGLHVLQIVEVELPKLAYQKAYGFLYNQKADKKIKAWLNKLKETNPVVIMSANYV